jgi:predicted XRE-type DNA-binding protein
MKSTRYKKMSELAEGLGLTQERGKLAEMKAMLTVEINKSIKKQNLTHQEVADLSSVPRSAVTGIVNNSLQKVTLDRLVRILNALGRSVELKVKNVA